MQWQLPGQSHCVTCQTSTTTPLRVQPKSETAAHCLQSPLSDSQEIKEDTPDTLRFPIYSTNTGCTSWVKKISVHSTSMLLQLKLLYILLLFKHPSWCAFFCFPRLALCIKNIQLKNPFTIVKCPVMMFVQELCYIYKSIIFTITNWSIGGLFSAPLHTRTL